MNDEHVVALSWPRSSIAKRLNSRTVHFKAGISKANDKPTDDAKSAELRLSATQSVVCAKMRLAIDGWTRLDQKVTRVGATSNH